MIIDNEKIFQTEDIDDVQELYEDNIRHFSEHTYNENIDTYEEFLKELWGDDWQEMYSSIYGDAGLKQFKKDYKFELKEFNRK